MQAAQDAAPRRIWPKGGRRGAGPQGRHKMAMDIYTYIYNIIHICRHIYIYTHVFIYNNISYRKPIVSRRCAVSAVSSCLGTCCFGPAVHSKHGKLFE